MTASRTIVAVILVAVAALIGALAGGAWADRQPDRYSTTTTVAIAPAAAIVDDADVIDVVGGLDRGAIVETLAGLVTSSSVIAAAAETVGIPPGALSDYDVEAVRVTSANLVDISVSGPDPQSATDLANTAAATAASQFDDLYRVYQVDVVTPADVPGTSDRPPGVLVALAGAVVGGTGAAIILAASRSRRRERHLSTVSSGDQERIAS